MRLVDADKLRYKHSLNTANTTMPQSFPCITKDEINNAPTVEAIPKADYENRLKADMVAILTEIQLEIEEVARCPYTECIGGDCPFQDCMIHKGRVVSLIQSKINLLKENKGNE